MAQGKRAVKALDYFPAKPRQDGYYQKRIRGKLHYFGGPGINREDALIEYQRVRRALYDGRAAPPPAASMAGVSLRDLMNLYLAERERDVDADLLTHSNHVHSRHALRRFARFVGPDRAWSDISAAEFSDYIRDLSSTYGVFAYNQHIAHINAFWAQAASHGWIDAAPNRGPHWKKRKLPTRTRPDVVLSPATVKTLVKNANPTMRAMILFSLNCGAGPTDCAVLEWADFHGDWYDNERQKTSMARRFPLWKVTREALDALPRGERVFSTAENQAWLPTSIAHAFRDLAGALVPDGQGLRCCRYTFSTLADETLDVNAKRLVMGHAPAGMDRHYVRLIGDVRLRTIVDHVRRKLKVPERLKGWV